MLRIQMTLIAFLIVGFLVGCSGEPEIVVEQIEITRVVTEEVPVTVIVENTVEVDVTRLVEIEKEVEIEIEVTRLVERVVTATPSPTREPTATPVPSPTLTPSPQPTAPPSPDITAALLESMNSLRRNLEVFGGLIDVALNTGTIKAQEVVDLYDLTVAAPTYDVTWSSDSVQNAYNSYRTAVDIFAAGARDMAQNCRDFLAGGGGTIPFQQWGVARQRVNDALDVLIPAIEILEGG